MKVGEKVVVVRQVDEAGDLSGVEDVGGSTIDLDGEQRLRRDVASIDDGRRGVFRIGPDGGAQAGQRARILNGDVAVTTPRDGGNADMAIDIAAIDDPDAAARSTGVSFDAVAVVSPSATCPAPR